MTRGSGVTRADPGKRDPGLRGYLAKRDQGAPGDPGKSDKEGPPGKTPGGHRGMRRGAWGGLISPLLPCLEFVLLYSP